MYPGAGMNAAATPKTRIPTTNRGTTIRRSGFEVEVIDPQIVEGGPLRNAAMGVEPLQRRRQSDRRPRHLLQLSLEDDVANASRAVRGTFDTGRREEAKRLLRPFGKGVVVGPWFIGEESLRQRGGVDEQREVAQLVAVQDEVLIARRRGQIGCRFAERRAGKRAMSQLGRHPDRGRRGGGPRPATPPR